MKWLTFFSGFKNNLKCAMCKNKGCPVKNFSNRKRIYPYSGVRYADECRKLNGRYFDK